MLRVKGRKKDKKQNHIKGKKLVRLCCVYVRFNDIRWYVSVGNSYA